MIDGWIRLYADSARHGRCPRCGGAIRWWDSPNGRSVALEADRRPECRDVDRRAHRMIACFAPRALHRPACPARAAGGPRKRRPLPGQIDLFEGNP